MKAFKIYFTLFSWLIATTCAPFQSLASASGDNSIDDIETTTGSSNRLSDGNPETAVADTTAFQDYESSQYAKAAKGLKKLVTKRDPIALQYYAEICHRGLDNKPHTYKEAAMYYIVAASSGNTDIFSYLHALDPKIVALNESPATKISLLVRHWETKELFANWKELKFPTMGKFLAFHGSKIGKVKYQKIPYCLQLVVSSLCAQILVNPISGHVTAQERKVASSSSVSLESENSQQPLPPLSKTCREELKKCYGVTQAKFAPWQYGPVCPGSFDTMETLLGDKKVVPKPTKCPKVSPLQRFMLKSVQSLIDEMSTNDLSQLTHENIAWIRAGLRYFAKEHGSDKYREQEETIQFLLETPQERLEPNVMEVILQGIDPLYENNEDIWPNESDGEVVKEFRTDFANEFTTERLLYSPLSRQLANHFIDQAKHLKIDLLKKDERAVLKEGFILQFCEKLELINVGSVNRTYEYLYEACFHLGFLKKLCVTYKKSFSEEKPHGKKIKEIFAFLEYRGAILKEK